MTGTLPEVLPKSIVLTNGVVLRRVQSVQWIHFWHEFAS